MDTLYANVESYTLVLLIRIIGIGGRLFGTTKVITNWSKYVLKNILLLAPIEYVFRVVQGKKWWSEIENSVEIITLIMVFV